MPVHADWDVCAHCGEPLRPGPLPSRKDCDHEFVIEGPHCIRCGFNAQPLLGMERWQRWLLACTLIVLGAPGTAIFWNLLVTRTYPNSSPYAGRTTTYLMLLCVAGLLSGVLLLMDLLLRRRD